MRWALDERLLPALILGVVTAAIPAAILLAVGRMHVELSGEVHFFAVGISALAAAGAALALTFAGARFGDTRTVLVGIAFSTMAALLALHAISTPGVLFGPNGVVTFTGGATLPVGGAILVLSAFRPPPFLHGVTTLLVLQVILIAIVIGLGVTGFVLPQLVPPVPTAHSPSALAVLAGGLVIFTVIVLRAFRTCLLTRRGADPVVTVGVIWLATALVPALTMTYDELGWWLGQALELEAIFTVGLAVAIDLAQTARSRAQTGDIAAASRLRTLAIGGLVHDIGKLSVPDAILKKPGALTADEFAVIRKHPEWGVQLLVELGSFPEGALRLVRDHHERLDGAGYPHGAAGDEIEIDTRILTVCDVYDALISPRVYRPARDHETAMALLRGESGTAFDACCVDALERVLAREAAQEAARGETRLPARLPAPRFAA
jgi:hypothetical protein